MKRFRLYTFNSNLKALFDCDGKIAFRVIIVTFLLVLIAEMIARLAFTPIGTLWEYWNKDAARKFSWYARAAEVKDKVPDILIVGDSTGARNISPAAIESSLESGVDAYNLAWPANFPAAFALTTVPMLNRSHNVPRIVVVSLSPGGFRDVAENRRFEAGILSCAFCRRQTEGPLIEDFIWLSRTRDALLWRELWFHGKLPGPPGDDGFMPLEGNEPPDSNEGTTTINKAPLSRDRMKVLLELRDVSRRRGFHLVLIVPPRRERQMDEEEFVGRAGQLGDESCTIIDARSAISDPNDFHDEVHLNGVGADRFSRWLATEYLAELLSQKSETDRSSPD